MRTKRERSLREATTINSFQLTTSQMVGLDPGYDVDAVSIMGCLIEPCRPGWWRVKEFPSSSTRVPGPVVVLHSSISELVEPANSRWHEIRASIGGDGGVEGLYDIARFGDAGVIPPNHQPRTDWSSRPSKRWYGYICDVVLSNPDCHVVVHPFGCTIHWDAACSVSTLADPDGTVVGVRLKPFEASSPGHE